MGVGPDATDAGEWRAEVDAFGLAGSFAAAKAVGTYQVYAGAQGSVAELTAPATGQVGGEVGLGLGGSVLFSADVLSARVRVACFAFHVEVAVDGRALLITQRVHGETDFGSNF